MLHGSATIFRRDMRVLRRSLFSELLAVVAYPLTIYAAFAIGLRGYIANVEGIPYPVFIAPGLISLTAVNAAFDEGAWSMWFHRQVQRTIEAYRTTPLSTSQIVIGKIFSGFAQGGIKGVVVAIIIFLIAPFPIHLSHLAIYLLFIAFGSMIFSCLGTLCGTLIDKPENIGRVQAVLIVPLTFMSGIFFPLSAYPEPLLSVIRLFPTTAIFDGARLALVFGSFSTGYLVNLFFSALVAFFLTTLLFNRRMSE
jgi:lipooligosaccharide transport system permease protein